MCVYVPAHMLSGHAEKALNGVVVYVSVCFCVILVWIGVLSITLQGNLSP